MAQTEPVVDSIFPIDKYSNINKVFRVTSYVLKLVDKLRKRKLLSNNSSSRHIFRKSQFNNKGK